MDELLVDLLRSEADHYRSLGGHGEVVGVLIDAANEIERLRRLLPKPTIPAGSTMMTTGQLTAAIKAGEFTIVEPRYLPPS